MCGYDRGEAGRSLVKSAQWVCMGGSWVRGYLDPKGDRSTLRCGRRSFYWGDREAPQALLQKFDPIRLASEWVQQHKSGLPNAATKKPWDVAFADALALAGADKKALLSEQEALVKVLTKEAEQADRAGFLAHRTTMRNYYLRDFKQDRRHAAYRAKLDGAFRLFVNQQKSNEKAKQLRELLADVLTYKRAPDGQWFQQVRNELKDPKTGGLKPFDPTPAAKMREVLISAFLHFAIFELIEHVREGTRNTAKAYFVSVNQTQAKAPQPLTRFELLETVREAAVSEERRGPVFCVQWLAHAVKKGLLGKPLVDQKLTPTDKFLCASSPLVLAGAVEYFADQQWPAYKAKLQNARKASAAVDDAAVWTNALEDIRNQMKSAIGTGWCYGAIPAYHLSVKEASYALRPKSGSPWLVEPPKVEQVDNGWLKCGTFQFTDEVWLQALLKDELKPEHDDAAGDANAEAQGAVDASRDNMAEKVGGFMGMVLDIVNKVTGIDLSFVQKYLDQLKGLVQVAYELAQGKLKDPQAALEKAHKAVDSLTGNALSAAEAKAKGEAMEKLAAARVALKPAEDAVKSAMNEARAIAQKLQSGGLLRTMANELIDLLSNKVTSFIEPYVKKLVAMVIEAIQPTVFMIKNTAVSAVMGVPFAGGLLANGVSLAFDWAWSKILDFLNRGLMKIVEKVLSEALRGVLGPIVEMVRGHLVKGVQSLCSTLRVPSDFCPTQLVFAPQDEWLTRMACNKVGPMLKRVGAELARESRQRYDHRVAGLLRDAPNIGKRIASHYLRKYGHTYDSWMAMAGPLASDAERALAAKLGPRIEHDLRERLAMSTNQGRGLLEGQRGGPRGAPGN